MPKNSIYKNLQTFFFVGSCLIIGIYLLLFYTEALGPGQLLGTSPLNLTIAGLHVFYYLFLRKGVNQNFLKIGTYVDLVLFSLNIMILALVTDGFHSPYYAFWLLILLAAGLIGTVPLLGYLAATLIYFLTAATLAPDLGIFLWQDSVYLLAGGIALISGHWLRRNQKGLEEEASNSQLNEISQRLTTEQSKSNSILRSIGDGVVVVDTNGTVQLINPPACELAGWSEDEALSIDYKAVLPLLNEQDETVIAQNDPFIAAFQSKQSIIRDDLAFINRDGKKIQLSLIVSPTFSEQGMVSGAVAVFRDISEEKTAARQRDEFISTASHEMRTPVAAIEGFLALALNDKVSKIDENARKYIAKAHDSTQHLGKLFQDLLSITRLEDNRMPSHPEPFNMGALVNEITEELQFRARQKQVGLKFQLTGSKTGHSSILPLFYVNADPERIREVLINLIDNALKFTAKGNVTVTVNGDDKQVIVGVHDEGVGIPKGEIKHLFQKFYRVDSSQTREIGGTGLGLYLCRSIIELYNGRIWVESQEGKGSNFYFSLPRVSQQEAEAFIRSESAENALPSPAPVPKAVATNISNGVE